MQAAMTKTVGWTLYVIYFGCVLLLPEIGARAYAKFSAGSVANPRYLEMSQSYPLLGQLLRDWSALRFGYRDYYFYSPMTSSSETVNFTSYFGARATPDSVDVASASEVIWAFGGSTMQNLESDDRLTLANRIAAELNQQRVPARVYNFGSGGFQSSLESAKFQELLRRTPQSEWPTTAIFYDGFNEAMYGYYFGPAALPQDISLKMKDLVEGDYLRLVAYMTSQIISKYSVFWSKAISPKVGQATYGSHVYPDRKNVERTTDAYATNVRMTLGICRNLNMRGRFFLQPLTATKSPLTALEKAALDSLDEDYVEFVRAFYARAVEMLKQEEGFHDISHILDLEPGSHFFDLGHTSPFSGVPIGKALAQFILHPH
jgi:hypothetical protein